MKQIFLFIFLISSLSSIAQTSVPRYELVTVSGTNTYTATVNPTPILRDGFKAVFKFTNANSGASTFNLNSSGAVTLRNGDGTALNSGDIPAGSTWWLVYDATASQWRLSGGGSGVNFTFSATAPSSTRAVWVDTGSASMQAYPIRYYINGAWTAVTDHCDWWDTIGEVISKGKPIGILFSGQSNTGEAVYTPQDAPSYLGDVSINKHITMWNNTPAVFRVYDWANYNTTGGNNFAGGPVLDGVGANNITEFARSFVKETGRSVRLVGTIRGGTGLVSWETGGASWTELKAHADASGVSFFDAFIWVHGEAGLGGGSAFSNYRDSFYNFISRIRTQSWGSYKTKVLFPSNALTHATAIITAALSTDAEATARGLNQSNDPYSIWVPISDVRELQNTGVQDAYHYTTREHERMGQAYYTAYKTLPNYHKTESTIRPFYTLTANALTSVVAAYPNTDDYLSNWQSITLNGGTFTEGFGAGNGGSTTKRVMKANGAFGRVDYELWMAELGTAVLADRNWRFDYQGNYFTKNTRFGSAVIPAAKIHTAAGSTTANTAPIKMDAGSLLTVVENGTFEYDGTDGYFSVGGIRYKINNPKVLPVACSDETTSLTTGTSKITFRMPYVMTLTSVRASLNVAQTSGTIFTVDINVTGTSFLSTKLTIDNTEKTSTTALTPFVFSGTTLPDDSEITIDIDLVGDGTAKGLKVTLIGY